MKTRRLFSVSYKPMLFFKAFTQLPMISTLNGLSLRACQTSPMEKNLKLIIGDYLPVLWRPLSLHTSWKILVFLSPGLTSKVIMQLVEKGETFYQGNSTLKKKIHRQVIVSMIRICCIKTLFNDVAQAKVAWCDLQWQPILMTSCS